MFLNKRTFFSLFLLAGVFLFANFVFSASPSGNNWFELLTSHQTGADNTGDGGSGNPSDYNYYYVGQTFTANMRINSTGSNAANIWIDHDATLVTSTNLQTGTYFPVWSGQNTVLVAGNIWRVRSTGYRTSGVSSGLGNFGSVQFTVLRPTAVNYGSGAPATLDINIGVIGNTTESNISYNGTDLLEDAEDFKINLWADTKLPYATNPNPTNGGVNFGIDSNYTFDLRDSKNGEGDDSGVGTGVNTASGAITFNGTNYLPHSSFSCSGIWGSNLCGVTINPTSPSGIAGDARNWDYNTTYTVNISNFRDFASTAQDQLGDANGPNTMDTKVWTFTTESDNVAPRVVAETPTRGSSSVSVDTNITIDVHDKKTYPGNISGTGVSPGTCRINISSPSFVLTTYQQGSGGVTVTAIDYGYRFSINPATDFAQNETVSVSVYDCEDLVGNKMTTDNYTFSTADTDAPFIDNLSPLNDAIVALNSTVSFHLKDTGTGVNLANTIFYINGDYYTNTGGAGSLSLNGKTVAFSTSSNFNGGNYAGDTTSRSGTPNDYAFIIDPQNNFISGEAIPIIVYTRDNAGNIMSRYVYAVSTGGGSCPLGSTYCGSNTSWSDSLLKCVGTGGGGGGGGGGAPLTLSINPGNAFATQVDASSVLITWYSSIPGSTRVVYGTSAVESVDPNNLNYGYPFTTGEKNDNSIYHSVVISGLNRGQLYYFRPITKAGGREVYGPELLMAPQFEVVREVIKDCPPSPVCKPVVPVPSVKPTVPKTPTKPTTFLKILNVQTEAGNKVYVTGNATPKSKIKATLY